MIPGTVNSRSSGSNGRFIKQIHHILPVLSSPGPSAAAIRGFAVSGNFLCDIIHFIGIFFQASFRTPFFLLSFIRRLRNAPCVCHRLHSPMLFIDRIAEFIGICPVFFPVTEICFDMPPDIFRVLHSIRLSVYFTNYITSILFFLLIFLLFSVRQIPPHQHNPGSQYHQRKYP